MIRVNLKNNSTATMELNKAFYFVVQMLLSINAMMRNLSAAATSLNISTANTAAAAIALAAANARRKCRIVC
ncbi:hypothetical protein JW960_11760 [candidate division KSB1 bacterium]|nr:hypothetical protein [candidate division KSB1 bacterium]